MNGLMAPECYTDEAARQCLEAQLWPDGPFCTHCGLHGHATKMNRDERSNLHGRPGLYQCRGCRKQFTVTVGTIFEDTKIPLHKWLLAIHLMCSSKKGVNAMQLQRELQLGSYRSAWSLCHKVRWAMTQSPMAEALESAAVVAIVKRNIHIPIDAERTISLLIAVKAAVKMPRPRAHRQKSLWSEVNEELS
jgi:transposase-like protein